MNNFKSDYLLADGAYDNVELLKFLFNNEIKPIIKIREFKHKCKENKFRKKAREFFNEEIYKLRGVIEAIFGGFETKDRLKLNEKLEKSRDICLLSTAISHNILSLTYIF
ncbi:transposase [Methanocaldococcus indicus]|uniref:transposase n=1 Tax=Methanocaldococcus indicus TaxID=213231 RepID=UPI003C6D2C5C